MEISTGTIYFQMTIQNIDEIILVLRSITFAILCLVSLKLYEVIWK